MNEINEEVYENYLPMVRLIANQLKRQFPKVDPQDTQQELWLWFVKHPNKYAEWKQLPEKDSIPLLAASLRNAGRAFCIKENAAITGYNPNDLFFYSKVVIKRLLPSALGGDSEQIRKFFSAEVKTMKAPSESGDWMAYHADIQKAFASLDEEDQLLVKTYYIDDKDTKTLHAEAGGDRKTSKATAMAANRALNRMVKYLGGKAPFTDNDHPEPEEREEDAEETHDFDD
jgi:hypothetical protein